MMEGYQPTQHTIVAFFYFLVDCGHPGTPANSRVVLFNDTLEDSIARYSCNVGFRLDGNIERVCQSNAMWTGEIPTCTSE